MAMDAPARILSARKRIREINNGEGFSKNDDSSNLGNLRRRQGMQTPWNEKQKMMVRSTLSSSSSSVHSQ